MVLLAVNYAIFNNPTLLIFGWIIAGIEAVTAVLQFLRIVFKNNKKVVEKIDKAIEKNKEALTKLYQKRDEYIAIVAYETAKRDTSIPEPIINTETDAGNVIPEHVETPADVAIPPADGVEEIETEPQASEQAPTEAPHFELNGESAELFAKFIGSIKKND